MTMKFCIFELVPNFSLSWQFEFLDQIYGIRVQQNNNQSNKLQAFAFCVVSVNSTIVVFEDFQDFKNLIILNILKENWFSLAS